MNMKVIKKINYLRENKFLTFHHHLERFIHPSSRFCLASFSSSSLLLLLFVCSVQNVIQGLTIFTTDTPVCLYVCVQF